MAAGNRKNPQRAKSSDSRYSLMEFMRDFPDDNACLNWLWQTSYALDDAGETAHCEKCDAVRVFARYETKQQRQSWTCTGCGTHVHPTAGTIFHKSSTSLHLWFYAIYLMSSTRCGISAKQLEREIGVTYKTAWRMFRLIRTELMADDETAYLTGTVEMDETFVGGKPRQSDRNRWATDGYTAHQAAAEWNAKKKQPVFGMVERGGKVAAYVVPSVQGVDLRKHVEARVLPEAVVHTDEAKQYVSLLKEGKYEHHTVQHKSRIYVEGDVHTQTIEGFWSLLKSGIAGAHHSVSVKYLQGYLNEYVWRYNHRDDDAAQFLSLILRAASV